MYITIRKIYKIPQMLYYYVIFTNIKLEQLRSGVKKFLKGFVRIDPQYCFEKYPYEKTHETQVLHDSLHERIRDGS